jgi:hypothetical protein
MAIVLYQREVPIRRLWFGHVAGLQTERKLEVTVMTLIQIQKKRVDMTATYSEKRA